MDDGSLQSVELEDLTRVDVEAQLPLVALECKPSILKRISTINNQSIIRFGAENAKTVVIFLRRRTPSALSSWAPFSREGTRVGTPDSLNVHPAETAFVNFLIGPASRSDELGTSCKWYTSLIRSRIEESWIPLFQPVLIGICCFDRNPCEGCMELAFACLRAVASVFQKKDLALVEMVDELYNEQLLKEGDEERSNAKQLAFAAFGWISLLYSPQPNPQKMLLEILDGTETGLTTVRRPRLRRSARARPKTFTSYCQSLDNTDQSLYIFLKRFGTIIPEPYRESGATNELANTQIDRHDGANDLSMVCFDTLHKFVGVKIHWVDCLSLHLEFDTHTKILKLFRFPSLCFIMCSNTNETLLSRIFQDSGTSQGDSSRANTDEAYEFFKEVLISYRLIFSQTKSSRKTFRKELNKWNLKARGNIDPLLEKLCGLSCDSQEVQDLLNAIEADDPSNRYNPVSDFPYLGNRLADIQDYVSNHKPKGVWGMWLDRRNVTLWWTFWAVIILGGVGVFLQMAQLAFQISPPIRS